MERNGILKKVHERLARAGRWIGNHPALVFAVCILIILAVKLVAYDVLPKKYWYDQTNFMKAAKSGDFTRYGRDTAALVVCDAFGALFRLLGPLSVRQCGWLMLLPGVALFAVVFWKNRPRSLLAAVLCCGFAGLLSIYVFGITKEIFQYGAFFLMFLCLRCIASDLVRVVCASAVLLASSLLFRSYYVTMLGVFLALYLVVRLLQRAATPKKRWLILAAAVAVLLLAYYVLEARAPKLLSYVFDRRALTNNRRLGSADAQTMMMHWLPNDTLPLRAANYLLNALRMLLPLELLPLGIFYIPFVGFQLLLTARLVICGIQLRGNPKRLVPYLFVCAYFLMSFFFETDFGTWSRHECAVFPLLWLALSPEPASAAPAVCPASAPESAGSTGAA